MTKLIFNSLILTLVLFLLNFAFKKKALLWQYLIYFLAIFFSLWFFSEKVEANEFSRILSSNSVKDIWDEQFYDCSLNDLDRARYVNLINFHQNSAVQNYDAAKVKCWWLPNISDRDKAKYCYTTLLTTLPASTPMSKIVYSLISFLTQYGLNCIDEWNEINQLLLWSQYHYEMKEFYESVLIKG